MRSTSISQPFPLTGTSGLQLSAPSMILLHLLPGGLTMLVMLLVSSLLQQFGVFPVIPVLFVVVAPVLILMQLGFLFYQGKRLNGKYSLQGIVLYRDHPMPGWKMAALALPILAWIAFVFFAARPPLMFSLYHFWSPWENMVRLLALTPWVYAAWRTRNIYLSVLIHGLINAFSGISLLLMVLDLT